MPQVSGPVVETVNSDRPSAAFTPTDADTYQFRVSVSDEGGFSDEDDVIITAVNRNAPPDADAGSDQSVWVGDTVYLDGGESVDPDGNELKYQWLQAGGPSVGIRNTDQVNALVFPDSTVVFFTDFEKGTPLEFFGHIKLILVEGYAGLGNAPNLFSGCFSGRCGWYSN